MSGVNYCNHSGALPITLVGLAALLLPSSFGSSIVPGLNAIYPLALSCFCLLFVGKGRLASNSLPLVWALAAIGAAGTVMSPLPHIAWGGLGPYGLISVLLAVDAKAAVAPRWSIKIFYCVSVILLAMGFGSIVGNSFVLGVVEKFYKAISDDLFESMILWNRKPVTVFASHSIAAFAYFGLGLVNYLLCKAAGNASERIIAGLCALGFVGLLPLLFSNSGLFLFLAALLIGMWDAMRSGRGVFVIPAVCAIAVGISMSHASLLTQMASGFSEGVASVVSYDASGVLGRYIAGGRLQPTYDYLVQHPLLPVGLSYSDQIALGDNFIAEYVIRFGVLGYVIILVLLMRFLRRWLLSELAARTAFLFFLISDLGYPLLPYMRVMGALPWMLVLLNAATAGLKGRSRGAESAPAAVTGALGSEPIGSGRALR